MKVSVLVFSLLLINSALCISQQASESFDYGEIVGNKYVNKYFGLEITFPSDWVVQSQEQLAKTMETGKKFVAGDDENMKAIINAADINVANLFAASQYPKGAALIIIQA